MFVIITLSLTYAPIGSAFATAFLYASIIGAICRRGGEVESDRAESLLRGLCEGRRVAARLPDRRVRLLPRLRQDVALRRVEVLAVELVLLVAEHLRDLARISSNGSFVASVDSMPNPVTSWWPAPRPTPSSNRPSERWSIIVTRSAIRYGWFTWD